MPSTSRRAPGCSTKLLRISSRASPCESSLDMPATLFKPARTPPCDRQSPRTAAAIMINTTMNKRFIELSPKRSVDSFSVVWNDQLRAQVPFDFPDDAETPGCGLNTRKKRLDRLAIQP